MNIRVVDYQKSWSKDFVEEKLRLKSGLGSNCVNIFHIGSTSVEGLSAKPIIDLLLVVHDLSRLDNQSDIFEALNYEVMGEFGIKGRRYYRKGGDERTHQIHAFHVSNCQEIERHLIFRDYLRVNAARRDEYATLKKTLAEKYPNDIEGYNDEKEDLVRSIELEALVWHYNNRE